MRKSRVGSPNQNKAPYCPIHNPKQAMKKSNPLSYSICMMKNCSNPYQILCPSCKNSHHSHLNKLIGAVELQKFTQNLVNRPFNKVKDHLFQLVHIMEALQWIQCFKSQIDHMLLQTQKETLKLIRITEDAIGQYAQSKSAAQSVLQELKCILSDTTKTDKKISPKQKIFKRIEELKYLEYNIIQNQLEFGGNSIKVIENDRRNMADSIHKKIDEIRNFGLKIVEVVLTSEIINDLDGFNPEEEMFEDSPQQREKMILMSKKQEYERLKRQLQLNIENSIHSKLQTNKHRDGNFNFNLIIGSIQNNSIYNNHQMGNEYLHVNSQIEENCMHKYEEALKEYENKFIAIEEKVKNTETLYRKKVEQLEDQNKRIKAQNQKMIRENQRVVREFQQRIKIIKKYEEELQGLKNRNKGKTLRTVTPQRANQYQEALKLIQ